MRNFVQRRFRYQRLEKLESLADLAGLGGALALGAVMLVGLLTASGQVRW